MDTSRKYIFSVSEMFTQKKTPLKFKVPGLKSDRFNLILQKDKFWDNINVENVATGSN